MEKLMVRPVIFRHVWPAHPNPGQIHSEFCVRGGTHTGVTPSNQADSTPPPGESRNPLTANPYIV